MARKEKKILIDGIDKREVGYYSTPKFIAEYLSDEMLAINPNGTHVLDPAVGKEELLEGFYKAGKHIESFDIVNWKQYKFSNFNHENFLDYYKRVIKNSTFPQKKTNYDYIIANPPYNCHEIDYIRNNKVELKKIFPVGVHNMYSLFLSAMINIAKDGCLMGIITCDSFLTSTSHSKLREQIFETCSIHQLILCPNDLFWKEQADVRTCILILQKGTKYQKNVKISDRPINTDSLKKILTNKELKEVAIEDIKLGSNKPTNQIIIDVDPSVVNLFSSCKKLGDVYPCVTCISTGNDSKYLSREPRTGYTIPFYKNPASRKFTSTPDAYLIDNYIEESNSVKDFMVRNKHHIGKCGIACSSMGLPFSAVYLPNGAVTGVNPTLFPPQEDINWLLAYLNSSLITYLVRGVLIRSNMVTSGYVSELPIIPMSNEVKHQLANISQKVRNGEYSTEEAIANIDKTIFDVCLLSKETVDYIKTFSQTLNKRV